MKKIFIVYFLIISLSVIGCSKKEVKVNKKRIEQKGEKVQEKVVKPTVLSNYEQKKLEWKDTTLDPIYVPIYMYHDVNTISDFSNGNSIPFEVLEKHFAYFVEKNRTAITLDDFIKYQHNELAIPRNSIVITFDDGYKNMNLVGPLLQKYNLFATTYLIGEKVDVDTYWFIDSNEVETLKSKNMFFGNHTFSMHNYGPEGKGYITSNSLEEGVKDLSLIRDKFNSNTVCYPFGHYNESAINIVKESKYSGAVTVDYGYAEKTMDSYMLPRIRVNASTEYPPIP